MRLQVKSGCTFAPSMWHFEDELVLLDIVRQRCRELFRA
jgi:hypothetical protein